MRQAITILVLFLSASCYASQAVAPTTHAEGNSDPNNNNIFDELNKELRNNRSNPEHAEGFGPVQAKQARMCEICKQPLYKHSDPNFECLPLDPDTGNPRKMLHITTRGAQCPVCNKPFIGAIPGNFNDNAGRDRDFCEHSLGRYTVHSRAWVCPGCGYAALFENFNTTLDGRPIDEATKQYVRDNLSDAMRKRMYDIVGIIPKANQSVPEELRDFGTYIPQNEIPDWVKYENALKLYERAKPPRGFLASLYLEAAHANRREVCSEISVSGLHNTSQVSLGRSIRLVNGYLQGQCMAIRRRQGAAVIDPTKMETDPEILAQAAQEIVRLGEENAPTAQNQNDQRGVNERYFSSGDMFVLNIRFAGALDRLGKIDEAERALRSAASYIPEHATGLSEAENTAEAREYYDHQVKLIRLVVDDRLACLKREKEYLFNAAKFNMVAIKLREVQFGAEAVAETDGKKTVILDAAPTSYLLAELLRRAGEPGAAAAWFDGAASIVGHRLTLLDKVDPQHPPAAAELEAIAAKRDRWMLLRDWIKEQRATIKTAPPVDANVVEAINVVLQSEGMTMQSGLAIAPARPAAVDTAPKKSGEPAVKSGKIGTRDELYKIYFKAIMAYRAAKGENPPALIDLVHGGYIAKEDACLDDKGKLVCPETGDKLGYSKVWDKGDKTAAIIFSITHNKTKRLYADGQIRDGDGK
jgi:hypothetical protein